MQGSPESVEFAIEDFATTLTERERWFLRTQLVRQSTGTEHLSDANRWQLTRRVRVKLQGYLNDVANI